MDNYFVLGYYPGPNVGVYEMAFKYPFDSLEKAREVILANGVPGATYIITSLSSRVKVKVTKELV